MSNGHDYLNDPVNRQNASVRLFLDLYEIQIPSIFLYSRTYLDQHNPLANEYGETDIAAALDFTNIKIPVAGIMDHFLNGVEIRLVKHEDAYNIKTLIMEHLNDWLYIVQNCFVDHLPSFKDLRDLERLAEILHPHAVMHKPEQKGNGFGFFGFGRKKDSQPSLSMLRFKVTDSANEIVNQYGIARMETVVDKIYNHVNRARM